MQSFFLKCTPKNYKTSQILNYRKLDITVKWGGWKWLNAPLREEKINNHQFPPQRDMANKATESSGLSLMNTIGLLELN